MVKVEISTVLKVGYSSEKGYIFQLFVYTVWLYPQRVENARFLSHRLLLLSFFKWNTLYNFTAQNVLKNLHITPRKIGFQDIWSRFRLLDLVSFLDIWWKHSVEISRFFILQFFREINFGQFRSCKTTVFAILRALNLANLVISAFKSCKNSYKSKYRASLNVFKWQILKLYHNANLISRKIWCVTEKLCNFNTVKMHGVEISRILLSLRFYVKSISKVVEVQKVPIIRSFKVPDVWIW